MRRAGLQRILRSAVLILGLGIAATAYSYDPLDFVPEQVPSARLSGSAILRHYGRPVYSAKLFIDPGTFSPEDLTRESFALDFEYRKACEGRAIAQAVATQMNDMGNAGTTQIGAWQHTLQRLLPDIGTDDHLTAVFWPGRGTGFFRNGEWLGDIPGNDFAKAYFGLWLDDTSTMPGMRQQLLRGAN